MKWAIRLTTWACVLAACLTLGIGCQDTDVDNDDDGEDKPPEGCKYTTAQSKQDFHDTPIPAGFFDFDGQTCEPFDGAIQYVGQPIDESESGAVDTVVHRDGDPISPSDPIGTEGTVGIEIVAMRLASAEPITVFCDGTPTEWDVSLDVSETAPSKGVLTATKEHANGGTATSTLFVYPRLTFTLIDDANVVRVFDTVVEGSAAVRFDATSPWAHALDPSDPDPGTDFLMGIDGRPDAQQQRVRGTSDPATGQEVDAACIRYVSPGGDHIHETCTVGGGST